MILEFYRDKCINNSTLFLVPLLPIVLDLDLKRGESFIQYLLKQGFINSYINDMICADGIYPYCLFLLFNKNKLEQSTSQIEIGSDKTVGIKEFFLSKKECVDFYKCNDNITFVFSIESLKEDYTNIIQGKYSCVSSTTMAYLKGFRKIDPIYNYAYSVMSKDNNLKQVIMEDLGIDLLETDDIHSGFGESEIYSGEIDKFDYVKAIKVLKKCNND